MRASEFRSPTLPRALVLGVLGGIALILVTAYSTRGPLIFFPYTALLAALGALVGQREPAFKERFLAILSGFMVASILLYAYIAVFDASSASSISLFGHAWRLAFLMVVGALLALAISYVTGWPTTDNGGSSSSDTSSVAV